MAMTRWMAVKGMTGLAENLAMTASTAEMVMTRLHGGDGDDLMRGLGGNDLLSGGIGHDRLLGDSGNDRLYGNEGSDTLSGAEGNDRLEGDEGDDVLRGGEEYDILLGGEGRDFLNGQGGDDKLFGDAGNDGLVGEAGNDQLTGGDGDDSIQGGDGDDLISGENGNDYLLGDSGTDTLYGSDGDDRIRGGYGDDTLWGGEGYDNLDGQAGADRLEGEAGSDSLLGGEGNDQLNGGDGDDTLDGGVGSDGLRGDNGSDTLIGDLGDDTLFGGEGNDRLVGSDGNDVMRGEGGDNQLFGGGGDDRLFGGGNDDTIWGGEGADELNGGGGNDLLLGEAGSDNLVGNDGNDILIGGLDVDSLNGVAGDDLLIGGLVSHSAASLELLMAAWGGPLSYEGRIQIIEDEQFEAYLQSEQTVFDDYVVDTVMGGTGFDWFFVPGAVSVYDPVMDHAVEGQQNHSGDHHGVNVIGHLPVVEGFELIDSLDHLDDVASIERVHTLIPHATDPSKRNEHLSLFELVRYDKVTHYAVASGNWSDSSIWHDGIVPAVDARVLIPIGIEVRVDQELAAEIATIRVDGTLSFATQVNTELRAETIIVSDVGSFVMGTAEQPIEASATARLVITDNGAINRDWDPYGISRGLLTHGSVSNHGAAVVSALEVARLLPEAHSFNSPQVRWDGRSEIRLSFPVQYTDYNKTRSESFAISAAIGCISTRCSLITTPYHQAR